MGIATPKRRRCRLRDQRESLWIVTANSPQQAQRHSNLLWIPFLGVTVSNVQRAFVLELRQSRQGRDLYVISPRGRIEQFS